MKRKRVKEHRRRVCPCSLWKQQFEPKDRIQTIGMTGASCHRGFDSKSQFTTYKMIECSIFIGDFLYNFSLLEF